MVGNVYNPANPYKHWTLQVISFKFIRIVYEIFSKKLWIMTGKKTLKKEEDCAPLIKVYIFSRINYNLLSAKTLSAMT